MDAYKQTAVAEAKKTVEQLDDVLSKFAVLGTIEEKTGVKRSYMVLGIIGFFLAFVLFGFGAGPLCNLIGFVYPLYASFKALRTTDKADDTQWLTYWIVYGFFTLIESFTDFFLFWIPFYYLFKILFLLWCFLPQFKGADTMYHRFIEPIFIKYETKVDGGIKSFKVMTTGKESVPESDPGTDEPKKEI